MREQYHEEGDPRARAGAQEIVIYQTIIERKISEHYYRLPDGTLVPVMPAGMQVLRAPQQGSAPQVLPGGHGPLLLSDGGEAGAVRPAADPTLVRRALGLLLYVLGSLALLLCLIYAARELLVPQTALVPPAAVPTPAPPAEPPAPPAPTNVAELGVLRSAPSISAAQIDAILDTFDSPARGQGQVFYDAGVAVGIDPAYALAFFIHESSAGTNPQWVGRKADGGTTHNVGNIICTPQWTAAGGGCVGRFRDYPSWEAGIRDWYRLINDEYLGARGLRTVADIVAIYAPAEDNNDVSGYVRAVLDRVATWRRTVPPPAAPAATLGAPLVAPPAGGPEPSAATAPATWWQRLQGWWDASWASQAPQPALIAAMGPLQCLDAHVATHSVGATVTTTMTLLLRNSGTTPLTIDPRRAMTVQQAGVDAYDFPTMDAFTLHPARSIALTLTTTTIGATDPLTLTIAVPDHGVLVVPLRGGG